MTLKTSEVSNSSSNLVNVFERFQNLKKEGGGNCKGGGSVAETWDYTIMNHLIFCKIKKLKKFEVLRLKHSKF